LVRFCEESGPVEIVLFQVGDALEDYIFVKHELGEPVRRLLASWDVGPKHCSKRLSYAKLGILRLESLLR
jgi:hypothetical protein